MAGDRVWPATLGEAAPKGAGPSLRGPWEPAPARCAGAGLGARRGPRLGRGVLPLRGKPGGRPVSPGSPERENRQQKREEEGKPACADM